MPTNTVSANALLLGGPYRTAGHEIVAHVADHGEIFKMRVENRYDHFAPTEEFVQRGESALRVFRYARHTYVAE
ncbi:DUF5988 family protein [Streptomyces mangrovisoli]|uniref:Uncharacterized protein n=1 Tax=Streptomyces mangrovisoli TaxID=1428628 RepID=A0A1J4P436_9ACTN|nr:DUF5988 family protein [Streptomyces mangrovisoli]OIJ68229.1 hypothetical protein WN71_009345 [Streptomyces mangrovisoli]